MEGRDDREIFLVRLMTLFLKKCRFGRWRGLVHLGEMYNSSNVGGFVMRLGDKTDFLWLVSKCMTNLISPMDKLVFC